MSRSVQATIGRKKGHRLGTEDDEVMSDSPLLAQLMLDADRNKHESNRLLTRIEENTAH